MNIQQSIGLYVLLAMILWLLVDPQTWGERVAVWIVYAVTLPLFMGGAEHTKG